MLDLLTTMKLGALEIASYGKVHTTKHAAAGFSRQEWELLTKDEIWTAQERRQVRSVLAEAVNVSLTLAGLPAEPLPGQLVAAVISVLVAPCNRIVAAARAPESYDAVSASGIVEAAELITMERHQMTSLVLAYSGQSTAELPGWDLEVLDRALREAEDGDA